MWRRNEMETLQANLTAACPLTFGGATGNLFAGAIATVVAAHCAFYDGLSWPKDNAEEIFAKPTDAFSYDFVIVGAGTAGSLLTNRLSKAFPSQSILLIEAGGDPGLNVEVPAFVFQPNPELDWHYETESNDKSCQGFKNKACVWTKGKGIGGSSAINAMLYMRGHPKDFDKWESFGNKGWGYKDVSKYFAKLENEYEFYKYKNPENPWHGALEASWLELNFTQHRKSSNEALNGIRLNKLMVKDGRRFNTGRFYLKDLNNVHILKNTFVQKVLIDPATKTAIGVQVRHNGIVMEIKANMEVILSAGSIATPQLLMLSGIGPKKHLDEKKITCIKDLPVGQNLQDHILLPFFLKTNLDTVLTPQMVTSYLIQYMLSRSGPFSNIGVTDFIAFVETEKQGYPDIQFAHTYFTQKDNFTLKPYMEMYEYSEEVTKAVVKLNEKSDLIGLFPVLLHPKSRGEVLLADGNPTTKPVIKPNYFQNPEDFTVLMKSLEYIHKLENTTVFKALGIELPELDIKECEESAEYWECYTKYMSSTMYHPVGTAKMGPKEDESSVVSPNLLVHGFKNLRVVDASIMPEITGGTTMGPTLMIADKASEIIKKKYTKKDAKDEL